jgi:hypothetical protein|tara:strand:- start:592 stop:762 length:171 start_codon:yes stop_codon:yes gene_type:complete
MTHTFNIYRHQDSEPRELVWSEIVRSKDGFSLPMDLEKGVYEFTLQPDVDVVGEEG